MIQDPHDTRPMRMWVKLGADGSIVSVHEHAAEVEEPSPLLVETTDLYPFDTTALAVDPNLVQTLTEAHENVLMAETAVVNAKAAKRQAHVDLKVAVTNAGLQQKARSSQSEPTVK